ncbi:MAG: YbjN domain-containing protein [Actinomycetaceae bacterium]|nr:YbjN domain-containing protein [Actinomycetaceae bacterium]
MGLFSPRPTPIVAPPLTQKRITAMFDEAKWRYFIDNEGTFGTIWDDNTYLFFLHGPNKEILNIQGKWSQVLSPEHLDSLREFITRWHQETLWPKCFFSIDDHGRIRVLTEFTIDHEMGVTDKQLHLHISCAIGLSTEFFTALGSALDT